MCFFIVHKQVQAFALRLNQAFELLIVFLQMNII
jgi:hypothetical protein